MKRRLILAAGIGVLTVATATPAMAFFSAGAASNFNVTATAVTVGSIPAAKATSARDKQASLPSFTVAAPGAPGATGYQVFESGTTAPICTITGATGTCQSTVQYSGGRIFTVKPVAGPWVGSSSVTCTYHDNNDTAVTCS